MHFIVDRKYQVVFGFNLKCGSSHIKKIIRYLAHNEIVTNPHSEKDWNNPLPVRIELYTVILIVRNPYERLVAGFLDRYSNETNAWKDPPITFQTFVDALETTQWETIDPRCFAPQTSEWFQKYHLLKSKCLKIYDHADIDFLFLERIYKRPIPNHLKHWKKPCSKKTPVNTFPKFLGNLDIRCYSEYTIPFRCFYNPSIQAKVESIYQDDFSFFKERSFPYHTTFDNSTKCMRKECNFLKHANVANNGGTHCCRKCKANEGHGHLCTSVKG